MPRRNLVFATDEVYHVFNRSVASEPVFSKKFLPKKALEIIDFYRFPQNIRLSLFKKLTRPVKELRLATVSKQQPLVEIYSWALMPNHYHFLVKQARDGGISRFVSNFQNSFAKCLNLRRNRNGAVFQNPFRARRVETEEDLLHVSRYIHLNPVTAYLIPLETLGDYPWTSFPVYRGKGDRITQPSTLLALAGSEDKYSQFVIDQADYQRKLHLIKHLLLE